MSDAARALELLRAKRRTLAVAESFTGGRVMDQITNVPGSSDVFRGGFVAYHNDVKTEDLRVPTRVLRHRGAVSRQTAARMAENVRRLLRSDVGLATTGIAGPTGSTATKPLGLSFVAVAVPGRIWIDRKVWKGDRLRVKQQGVDQALRLLLRVARRNR